VTTQSRGDLPPVKARLTAGHKTQVTNEERASALRSLARQLEAAGLAVDLRIAKYEPGIRAAAVDAEQIALFIGGVAATGLIENIVTDAYNLAKEWARERFRGKGRHARTERVIVHAGGVIRMFEISSQGENETVGDDVTDAR
jgi:hypothetical protein